MSIASSKKHAWLEEATSIKPTLLKRKIRPIQLVRPERDNESFQGWRMAPCGKPEEAFAEFRGRTWETVFDFGEHCVGRVSVKMEGVVDCPQRINFIFGETPAEIGESFDSYQGSLGKAWLQEESVVFDLLPASYTLPRRYAFRYLKVSGDLNAPAGKARLADLTCETESSADYTNIKPLGGEVEDSLRKIDSIALKTLANCMQDVFEDGPKRDRRLWLGDYRLQALLNYRSFKNYALAKRCLLLFAGLSDDNDRVPTCLFHTPEPHPGNNHIFDYISLFGASILEYAEASGDWNLAQELWPLALRQTEIVLSESGPDDIFQNKAKWWCFIDWNNALDRTCAEQAVSIFCLKSTASLARALGHKEKAAELEQHAARLSAAALKHLYDPKKGVFVSGPERQVSWASQLWMCIAGVVEGETAANAIRTALSDSGAQKAVSPYLHHYLVEAMIRCGMKTEAFEHIKSYWGKMADLGADTFWEVFDPENQKLSPYGSHLMNSCCHAWSCTPSYFIRGGKES